MASIPVLEWPLAHLLARSMIVRDLVSSASDWEFSGAADLVGAGRDTVGVGSWLAERDGAADPSMVPPPAHEASTATTRLRPVIFMTRGRPTPPRCPVLLPTRPPMHCVLDIGYAPARYRRHSAAAFASSEVESEDPAG